MISHAQAAPSQCTSTVNSIYDLLRPHLRTLSTHMSEHESEADPVSVRTTTDASHDQVAAIGNTIDTNSEAVIPDVTTKVDTHVCHTFLRLSR